ncbi:Hydroxyethylthiazole kinase [Corynebacterium glyciniphilum AJ 3170]|uniref:Hydroxyethylthiazole kinase n=1 Tax=Corynebacterium glyciniphilum AJ 3170 TaxID=1404245 RepID=X5DMA9_9CORY|nr:Hydroxyethylthiazole kinase [Corynebacterium glyciniphilum AJ 3170]
MSDTLTTIVHTVHDLRQHAPLVQCITNQVVPQITANALLAAGASPAMVDTPEEAADFAAIASGLLVNTGSPTAAQYSAMREAVRGATAARTPWVLDPVACGGPAARTEFSRDIVAHRPAAVRANASEVIALADSAQGRGGRGVDSTDEVDAALQAAQSLTERTGSVVAVSGPQDLVVSVGRVSWLASGDPMMQRVIGTGCSLGALTAAYLGAARTGSENVTDHDAVLTAHAHVGAAGTLAAKDLVGNRRGPGSFAVAWLDALATVAEDPSVIAELVSVTETVTETDEETAG